MKTENGYLMLKPYEGSKKIEAEVKNAFATIKQRTSLVGLELLADAKSTNGNYKKGQIVFFLEEELFNKKWSKEIFTCEGVEGKFVLGLVSDIVLVK